MKCSKEFCNLQDIGYSLSILNLILDCISQSPKLPVRFADKMYVADATVVLNPYLPKYTFPCCNALNRNPLKKTL